RHSTATKIPFLGSITLWCKTLITFFLLPRFTVVIIGSISKSSLGQPYSFIRKKRILIVAAATALLVYTITLSIYCTSLISVLFSKYLPYIYGTFPGAKYIFSKCASPMV